MIFFIIFQVAAAPDRAGVEVEGPKPACGLPTRVGSCSYACLTILRFTSQGNTSLSLYQWFLTLLEVLNRTSSIHAAIELFVIEAFSSSSNAKHVYITIYCISAHTSGVTQTAEPLKLTHRTPAGGSIEPRLRTLLYTIRVSSYLDGFNL